MIDYSAWQPGCTDYSCGGARRMFVAPATLLPPGLAAPVTGMASTPTGDGYWLVDAAGAVSSHGSAVSYGSMAGQHLNAPINHIVATPDGRGLAGGLRRGDLQFRGRRPSTVPWAASISTPAGGRHRADVRRAAGYWLVAADGGIFSFGDAAFHGSMGGQHLNRPVVGISPDHATGGYWRWRPTGASSPSGHPSSAPREPDPQPAGERHVRHPDGGGYRFVASDGGHLRLR